MILYIMILFVIAYIYSFAGKISGQTQNHIIPLRIPSNEGDHGCKKLYSISSMSMKKKRNVRRLARSKTKGKRAAF